ncbi:flagellar basal body protein FliL [Roseomonas sp. KE2513]|uniref:flagellar basal body-associated FliL family protein n=1 Tax=Roseomonas sp. KE2513 TaxID=2479202 RepID=UPI0018DF62BF|nr:flagellar basal body-associated FliL family protein [Roseomonas sp. KE2513]MBI0535383.1 flagellar basal body protein FliL [Roseomonas sp. KE2513]
MSSAAITADEGEAASVKGGKKKLIVIALVPLLLGGAGAGLWFSGLLPFGKSGDHAAEAPAHGAAPSAHGAPAAGHGAPAAAGHAAGAQAGRGNVFLDMPEVLTNLNVTGRRATFIRLRAKLELAADADIAATNAAMPRLLDLSQTYLREMRPEELRGSQGTYRLREELRNRASVAVGPGKVLDVLFVELIVQ